MTLKRWIPVLLLLSVLFSGCIEDIDDFTIVTIDVYKQKNISRYYGVRGTPHELFLYPNGTEIKRLPGYVDNQTFLDTINEIALLTRGLKKDTY
jgi:thioredoxin-related protein